MRISLEFLIVVYSKRVYRTSFSNCSISSNTSTLRVCVCVCVCVCVDEVTEHSHEIKFQGHSENTPYIIFLEVVIDFNTASWCCPLGTWVSNRHSAIWPNMAWGCWTLMQFSMTTATDFNKSCECEGGGWCNRANNQSIWVYNAVVHILSHSLVDTCWNMKKIVIPLSSP